MIQPLNPILKHYHSKNPFSKLFLLLLSPDIVHRDLKPANILLKHARPQDPHTIVKVCDFGLSKNIDASSLKTKVGTPMFVAPEVLFGNRYDKKVDVWSLGVILYLW